MARTTDVRREHAIDEGALKRYLDEHAAADLPGYQLDWQLSVRQFNAGQSNPTYLLTLGSIDDDSSKLCVVLRKRPPRVNVASAHNVSREFRVLRALGEVGESVPVPRVYHLFEAGNYDTDPSGVGTDFYLMEFVDGDIFDDPALLSVPMKMRAAYYLAASRALASLHQVPANPGTPLHAALQPPSSSRNTESRKMPAPPVQSSSIIGASGSSSDSKRRVHGSECQSKQCPGCTLTTGESAPPPTPPIAPKVGYFARQLRRLSAVSDVQAKDAAPVPEVKSLVTRLQEVLASTDSEFPSCLVHGDFKMDNMVFAKRRQPDELPKVIAVLDWEMCALGHPMADLANLTMVYFLPRFSGLDSGSSAIDSSNSKSGSSKSTGSPPPALQGLKGLNLTLSGLPSLRAVATAYATAYANANGQPPDSMKSPTTTPVYPPHPLWESGAFMAFLFFKNAVITQGVAARAARGSASSSFAKMVGTLPPLLASDCARLLKRGLGDAGGGLSFEACAKVAHSNSGMSRIRAVIFDVGGVLTPSPFEALTAWEKAHNLPPGYATAALGASSVAPQTTAAVTAAISSSSSPASSSSSVFAALERGERRPDDAACADLALQMSSPSAIARYLKLSVREKNRTSASSAEAFAKAASAAVAAAALDSSKVVALLQMMAAPIAQGPIHAIAEVVMEARAAGLWVAALTNDMLTSSDPDPQVATQPFFNRHHQVNTSSTKNPSPTASEERGSTAALCASLPFHAVVRSSLLGSRKPEPRAFSAALDALNAAAAACTLSSANVPPLLPHEVVMVDDLTANLRGAERIGLRTCHVDLRATSSSAVKRRMEEEAAASIRKAIGLPPKAGLQKSPSEMSQL